MAIPPGLVVSRDQLIDALWGDDPPASAANGIHRYVAGLRDVLEPGRPSRSPGRVLIGASGGYTLGLDPGQVDVSVFGRCLRQARESRAADRLDVAVVSFDRALGLWAGTPLSGVPGPFAEVERARLSEEYRTAMEERAEALLASGRAADVAAELAAQVRDHPLRERLRGLLMLALYRAGRQAEALAVFRDGRRLLVEELGIEPGPELQRLHRQILAADDALMPAEACLAGSVVRRLPACRVTPAQLPHDTDGFTGRDAELARSIAWVPPPAAVDSEIPDPVPVVITVIDGTAGVGKTAFAVHVAHRIAAHFPDGQLFIDLRGFTPHEAPMTAGDALGHLLGGLGADPQHLPADPDDRAAMYRTMLAGRRVLIVLDNANSAAQVRPLLPGTGTCQVLITSRNRLDGLIARDGARRVALDVLNPDEATTLLGRFCRAGQVTAEPGAAADLARLCGYLPLALRIVAQRAAARVGETLSDLATGLAAEHERLDLLEFGDDVASVRAAFRCSYHALPANTAAGFRVLGTYPGVQISAPAAAALLGSTQSSARLLLDELARRHLIEDTGRGRYRLHDLIRCYAAEQAAGLPRHLRNDAARRLFHWYVHSAAAADAVLDPRRPRMPLGPPGSTSQPLRFGSYADALHWCDAERDNFLAVTRHAADSGQNAQAWQLPLALVGYFYLKKPWTTWRTATQIGLCSARRAGDPLAEAATRTSLGIAYSELQQSEAAIGHLNRALTVVRARGHRNGEAIALVILGAAHRDMRRYARAMDCLSAALAIWRDTRNRWGIAIALQYLGETHLATGQVQRAITELQEALRIRHDIGDKYGTAWTNHDLASAYRRLGDMDTALSHFYQALAIRRRIEDRWGEARTLSLIGETLSTAGRRYEAHQALATAHAIFTELGDPRAAEIENQLRGLCP